MRTCFFEAKRAPPFKNLSPIFVIDKTCHSYTLPKEYPKNDENLATLGLLKILMF